MRSLQERGIQVILLRCNLAAQIEKCTIGISFGQFRPQHVLVTDETVSAWHVKEHMWMTRRIGVWWSRKRKHGSGALIKSYSVRPIVTSCLSSLAIAIDFVAEPLELVLH